MFYVAYVSREGENFLIEFPDCPGCQTFTDNADEVVGVAREALEGWLEAHLVEGKIPPAPQPHTDSPLGTSLLRVTVGGALSVVLQLRWKRHKRGMTQGDVARAAGVSQQQIAKLENPDSNPSLATIEKVAAALGLRLAVDLEG